MAIGWALVSTGRHADTCLAPAIELAEDTHLVAV
jgi:3-methyladenine DNA glycosylase AlkD